jgi:hypothetical protein
VAVNFQINQQAFGAAVDELLPTGGLVLKGPSYFLDRREIYVEVSGVPDVDALERAYLEMTGYRLRVGGEKGGAVSLPDASAPASHRPPMEINAAYGLIREALEPFGLSKTSLKQGRIVLTFISPQVGARHQAAMTRLADETGYTISVHPHPDQNAILQIAGREARAAGWNIRKGPGLRTDRGEVFITLAAAPNAESLTAVEQAVEAQTGYRLVVM